MDKQLHLKIFRDALRLLKPLNDTLVYTGGSVISTFIDEPEHITLRETIDCVIQAYTRSEYEQVAAALRNLGFNEDSSSKVICRFTNGSIDLDLMSSGLDIFGFSNKWYEDGCKNKIQKKIDEVSFYTFTPAFFIATKIEAFAGRGHDDYRHSHDMEDIITILDGSSTITDDVLTSPLVVKKYLQDEFKKFITNPYFHEALDGHISNRKAVEIRKENIIKKIEKLIGDTASS